MSGFRFPTLGLMLGCLASACSYEPRMEPLNPRADGLPVTGVAGRGPDGRSGRDGMEEKSSGGVRGADGSREESRAHLERASLLARRSVAGVAQARQLEVSGEFSVELITRDGVRTFVRDALHEDMPPEQLALLGSIEASFGVLPVDEDPERILLDLYEAGVLGIYDPDHKTLLIGDFVDSSNLGRVVGHECAHGLQDMHFDLEALQQMHPGQNDADNARTFLIEGDAEASYLASVSSTGIEGIGDAPLRASGNMALELAHLASPHATLARMMQMPYADGTRTIVALAQEDGWQAVNALYAQLPETTEQMLHLDKLRAREPAHSVEIDRTRLLDGLHAAGGTPLTVVWEDDLGEAGLLAMLADIAGAEHARRGADGWGGDRYVAINFESSPASVPMVVGAISWDRTRDATEFEPLFRDYLEKHKPDEHFVSRHKNVVVYATHPIEGASPQLLESLVWKSVRTKGARNR